MLKNNMYFLLIGVLFSGMINVGYALESPFPYVQLTSYDGLSSSSVKDILQDHDGFIWIATNDGLNRYDGYEFKKYVYTSFDPCSFKGNNITTLAEDASGNIWIGTFDGGVFYFDPIEECFEYLFIENLTQLEDGEVMKIHIDPQGIVWIITEHLIIKRYDPKTKEIISFGEKQEYRYTFNNILEDASGRYMYFDIWKKDVEIFDTQKSGKLWIYRGNDEEIEQVDITNGTSKIFKDPFYKRPNSTVGLSPFQNTIFRNPEDNTIWKFGTQRVSLFSMQEQKYIDVIELDNTNNHPAQTVRSYYIDASGMVWLGTPKGLYLINYHKHPFENLSFIASPSDPNRYPGLVESMYQDQEGVLWAVGHWAFAKYLPNSFEAIDLTNDLGGLIDRKKSRRPHKIIPDPLGRKNILWISFSEVGLVMYDKDTHTTKSYMPIGENSDIMQINDMIVEGEHILWLACNNGLQKFDLNTKSFTWYAHDPEDPKSIPKGKLQTVYKDHQGTLWIGTEENGLASFDKTNEQFNSYTHDIKKKNSLINNCIFQMHEDTQGNFWIATLGGLDLFDREKKKFQHFTIKNGLPKNRIMSILEDQEGQLWLGTKQGVSRFDPLYANFTNYDQRDGLAHTRFFPRSCFQNAEGKLFFAGENGIVSFNPKMLNTTHETPVVITRFKKFNQEMSLQKEIAADGVLELSYKDAVISFEIAALNHWKSYKNQYAYKLEGVHTDWIHIGSNRNINLTNLSPKDYVLKIKAANDHGSWNETSFVLPIHVIPPFWKTNQFRIFIGILCFLIVYGIYHFKIRYLNYQQKQLQKEVDLRTEELQLANTTKDRFFAIIAHDLRAPLVSFQEVPYLIDHFVKNKELVKIEELSQKIKSSSIKLNNLLDNLLKWAMVQQNMITIFPQKINLYTLVNECLDQYLGSIRRNSIKVHVLIDKRTEIYADYNTTTSIIRNLLSNAIKYTNEKGVIELKASSIDSKTIKFTIKDNGIGMSSETLERLFDIGLKKSYYGVRGEEGNGLGLILCKEFAKLNCLNLEVESSLNKGSQFHISFPGVVAQIESEIAISTIPNAS